MPGIFTFEDININLHVKQEILKNNSINISIEE